MVKALTNAKFHKLNMELRDHLMGFWVVMAFVLDGKFEDEGQGAWKALHTCSPDAQVSDDGTHPHQTRREV